MKTYVTTDSEITSNTNRAIYNYLEAMKEEKIISAETLKKLLMYKVVLATKWFFWTLFDKVFWLDKDATPVFVVVKIIK